MKKIRQHWLSRFLCGMVALIILNISVDAPDWQPNHVPEDLSYNDIESIVEWALEDVLQINNAIPEHDDADDHSPHKVEKLIELFFLPPTALICVLEWEVPMTAHNFYHTILLPQSATDELLQPPERA